MRITNADVENLHIFWTIGIISMKFSWKICLIIILKVTKNEGLVLSSEDAFYEKSQDEGSQIDPLPAF